MKRFLLLAAFAGLLAFAGPAAAADKNPVVKIETSMGDVTVELYPDKAPGTVKNFLAYVDAKHYDNTIFHRVIKDFMIQGGGIDAAKGTEKPTKDPIKNESGNGLKNERGTIAMARTSEPDSATAQFYINHGEKNDFLDKEKAKDKVGYCVFGKVTEGMSVVDKIANVETNKNDEPTKPVVIKSIRRVDK
jgi:cyclophilin family peptidyl-prolyl cis-trans isomerase